MILFISIGTGFLCFIFYLPFSNYYKFPNIY
nr:MAG TPA: hypothetical protein [Bacteriophage sp.]